MDETEDCFVCFNETRNVDRITFENCNHSICLECSKELLITKPTCPFDRSEIRSLKFFNKSIDTFDFLTIRDFIFIVTTEKYQPFNKIFNEIADCLSSIKTRPFKKSVFLSDTLQRWTENSSKFIYLDLLNNFIIQVKNYHEKLINHISIVNNEVDRLENDDIFWEPNIFRSILFHTIHITNMLAYTIKEERYLISQLKSNYKSIVETESFGENIVKISKIMNHKIPILNEIFYSTIELIKEMIASLFIFTRSEISKTNDKFIDLGNLSNQIELIDFNMSKISNEINFENAMQLQSNNSENLLKSIIEIRLDLAVEIVTEYMRLFKLFLNSKHTKISNKINKLFEFDKKQCKISILYLNCYVDFPFINRKLSKIINETYKILFVARKVFRKNFQPNDLYLKNDLQLLLERCNAISQANFQQVLTLKNLIWQLIVLNSIK